MMPPPFGMRPPPPGMGGMGMGMGRGADPNRGVIATNDSATEAKLSAMQLGYFKDKYITKVCPKRKVNSSPMVRRGYYTRVHFVEHCLHAFHAVHPKIQVISLGAGYDTSFFRLRSEGKLPNVVRWVDVDFPKVIEDKLKAMKNVPEFVDKTLTGDSYRAIGIDLREIEEFEAKLTSKEIGLDASIPTIIVSECVMVYMRAAEGDDVITLTAKLFEKAGFVTYEQINDDSPFGKMMLQNLEDRGCPLLSLRKYKTADDQMQRYKSCGYEHSASKTMNTIYDSLTQAEQLRLDKIERLDEVEEFRLIHEHYVFTVSSKGMGETWQEQTFLPQWG